MIQFKLIGKKYKMNYIIKNNNIIPTTTIKINFSRIIAISKEKNTCFLCYNNFYKYFFNPKNQKSLLKLFFKNILNKKLNKKLQKNLKLKNFYKISSNIDNKYRIGDFYYIKTINKENINIQGLTIGKGFSGKIKRHNMKRGPMSHGSNHHRRIGSVGTGCSRIFPFKRMPGQLGYKKVTIKNLKILNIDKKLNTITIKGSIPGKINNFLIIKY